MKKTGIVTILLYLSMVTALLPGTTGKIAGRLTDKKTGEGLPGANVFIEGTMMGSVSDGEGRYTIINIPPGACTIVVKLMGYVTQKVTDVRVSTDFTTELNLRLDQTVIESGNEVIIIAERPIVQMDLTNTMSSTSGNQIKNLPVETLAQVIEMQAGVVSGPGGLHFRGGRATEVAYLIDGIPVTNQLTGGGSDVNVENQGVQELQVISGTFNAEYGQAQSGIINIITREGKENYTGSVMAYAGGYVSAHKDVFMNINKFDPANIQNYQGTLSGPIPYMNKKANFFTSLRYSKDRGYLYGLRKFRIEDTLPIRIFEAKVDRGEIAYQRGTRSGVLNVPDSLATGDRSLVAMNTSQAYNIQSKFSFHLTSNLKLTYGFFRSHSKGQSYLHEFRYAPDGRTTGWYWDFSHMITMTHTLSSASFYELKFANMGNRSESYLFENPLDDRYSVRYFSSGSFNFGGTQNTQSIVKSNNLLAKFDLTSQIDKINLIKTGFEIKQFDFDSHWFTPIMKDDYDSRTGTFVITEKYIPDPANPSNNQFRYKPVEAAAYLQDKLELKEIILNIGIRYDYLNPDAQVPQNLRAIVENGRLASPFKKAVNKDKISPRLGISFPISDKGAIHLSYGHFFQVPPFQYLYDNSTFKIGVGGNVSGVVGNADLQPERTIAYEIGLQQELTPYTGISLTVYYKDIKNLLSMELISTENYRVYAHYINQDYGNVRGIVFSLDQRKFGPLSARLDYTYQDAKGNSSDPRQILFDNQVVPPRESEKQVLPLDWDQTHTLNATLSLDQPGVWGISLIGRLGTGQPYTPSNPGSALSTQYRNSARKPSTKEVDLRANRDFKLNKVTLSAFIKVYNLFDIKNNLAVFSSTGRADREYRAPGQLMAELENRNFTLEERDRHPEWYSVPRSVLLGFSLEF